MKTVKYYVVDTLINQVTDEGFKTLFEAEKYIGECLDVPYGYCVSEDDRARFLIVPKWSCR